SRSCNGTATECTSKAALSRRTKTSQAYLCCLRQTSPIAGSMQVNAPTCIGSDFHSASSTASRPLPFLHGCGSRISFGDFAAEVYGGKPSPPFQLYFQPFCAAASARLSDISSARGGRKRI